MQDETQDLPGNTGRAGHTQSLPPELIKRLEQLCSAFSAAWKGSTSPRLEDHLAAWTDTVGRDALLYELLVIELEHLAAQGQRPLMEEYLRRFPEQEAAVKQAFVWRDQNVAMTLDTAEKLDVSLQDTAALGGSSAPSRTTTAAELPTYIGRHHVERLLGQGAFGQVYLARDEQLDRRVAIKVPHADKLLSPEDVESYLDEARVVASLDHPHIVPVYDVGQLDDGRCYVVSKLIEGQNLQQYAAEQRISFDQAALLAAQIADALQHAHNRGLVHRDIKPANILMDAQGQPYVADFGLALRNEDFGKQPGLAGTPSYMSPEQARGEGHLVDGRSDLFSLGVVLYELLTGTRPFRGANWQAVLEQIKTIEARPLRHHNDAIPPELERICLKLLAKRASDRYPCGSDAAFDLRNWKGAGTRSPESKITRIVPKGLRSFDAADSDFFLDLVPGPRDREGLPESLRFWKHRIEENDATETFRVGLLYGPSGSGKSSLVKAGLLPRLADHVVRVFMEATPDDTEARLLAGLQKACPDLPRELGLVELISLLRRGRGLPAGRKVLLVIDQFEQWLHSHRGETNTLLADALRQCDGGRVQVLLLVRDDYWVPTSEFVERLDLRIVEGVNASRAGLFDPLHARQVLAEFGRAYGRLPGNLGDLSATENTFLDEVVAGLAEDGKVICVRLALFADMSERCIRGVLGRVVA